MKPNVDKWNIVVTGIWNVAIFDPPWIAANLVKGTVLEGKQTTQEIFMDAKGIEVRHTIDSLRLRPAPDRLVIGTASTTNDSLVIMQNAAISILEILKHTPITGMGINFGFISSPPTEDLFEKYRINDDSLLEAVCGGSRISSDIRRTLQLPNMACTLNHIISLNEKNFELQLNFHHNTTKPEQASSELKKEILVPLKEMAVRLVNEMYGGYHE
jgi:hypothetical protein